MYKRQAQPQPAHPSEKHLIFVSPFLSVHTLNQPPLQLQPTLSLTPTAHPSENHLMFVSSFLFFTPLTNPHDNPNPRHSQQPERLIFVSPLLFLHTLNQPRRQLRPASSPTPTRAPSRKAFDFHFLFPFLSRLQPTSTTTPTRVIPNSNSRTPQKSI